jgi:hypothetical protein
MKPPPSQFAGLKLAWTFAAKEALWALTRHRTGSQKDIALFSTRRSGSTWLMEVVAVNRGVRYIDQPFSLFRAAPGHLAHLLVPDRSKFLALDGEEEIRVRAFVSGLLDGSIQVNAPWALWRPTAHWHTDRVVLKIVNAKTLIDWFDQEFDLHIVYSTRHPIPASLSVQRNGWALSAPPYLRSPAFIEAHLTEAQLTFGHDVLRSGSPLEQHVLGWTLENLVPLRLLPERPHWHSLTYEEAILDPVATVERLSEALDLPDPKRMLRQVNSASRSTRHIASTFDPVQAGRERLRAWRRHVSLTEEQAAMRILERFEIDLYRTGEDLPAWSP